MRGAPHREKGRGANARARAPPPRRALTRLPGGPEGPRHPPAPSTRAAPTCRRSAAARLCPSRCRAPRRGRLRAPAARAARPSHVTAAWRRPCPPRPDPHRPPPELPTARPPSSLRAHGDRAPRALERAPWPRLPRGLALNAPPLSSRGRSPPSAPARWGRGQVPRPYRSDTLAPTPGSGSLV